jgi:hypothetical protein
MDSREFDRLVARASDPRLIQGIHNYCDGRCPRCPFTTRCLTYVDSQAVTSEDADESPAEIIGGSLRRTLDAIAAIAGREGVDQPVLGEVAAAPAPRSNLDRYRQDPLVVRAEEYTHLAWRISRVLAPLVAARGEASIIDAVTTIAWFSTRVSAKTYRAVVGQAKDRERAGQVQTDFNGSAKAALLGIAESRDAWRVLMEAGKATADGVPAQAVTMLDALGADVRTRFPQAMAFVRPGFDEPAIARSQEDR